MKKKIITIDFRESTKDPERHMIYDLVKVMKKFKLIVKEYRIGDSIGFAVSNKNFSNEEMQDIGKSVTK